MKKLEKDKEKQGDQDVGLQIKQRLDASKEEEDVREIGNKQTT